MLSRAAKVVILMATYNGEEHIEEQLNSIAVQTHPNFELIVSDDGSNDSTVELIRQFAGSVPQQVAITQGPRQGFWQNFLSLVKRTDSSRGDLFAFSDQDDIWIADKLERAVNWFADSAAEIPKLYFTRTALIENSGKPMGLSPLFRRPPTFQNALVQNMGGGNTMVLNRAAKEILEQTPDGTKLVAHDWWTYQVVTAAGGVAFYDPIPSVRYRQHPRNLIGSNRGVGPRLLRTIAFARRRWKRWNDVNLAALCGMRPLFSPSALRTIDQFSRARRSGLLKRIRLLRRSGVYRQNLPETIAMYVGAVFRLI